jgi:hypothetical protein
MTTRIGLYYPSIYFHDDNWLKLAALYWDRIARIVPPRYWEDPNAASRDSEAVRALQGELDFIEDLSPRYAADEVGGAFLKVLEANESLLGPRYAVAGANHWEEARMRRVVQAAASPSPWFSNIGGAQVSATLDPRLTYIHVDKVSRPLSYALVESGFAATIPGGEFLGVHPNIGGAYMAALAEVMARQGGLSPVTDDPGAHLAAGGWTIERLTAFLLDEPTMTSAAKSPRELEASLASLAISSVVPKDIQNVPIDTIVKLRKEHHDDFLAFHRAIEDVIKGEPWLADVSDPDALRLQLEVVYRNQFAPHLDRLERNLGLHGIRATRGAIGILARLPEHVPAIAGILGTVGAGALAPALAPAAAVIAITIVPILRDRAQGASLPGDAARAGYLLDIREGLTPASVTQGVASRAERIVARAIGEAGGATT